MRDHDQSTPTLSSSSAPPVLPAPPLPPPRPPVRELPIPPPGWVDTTGFRETFLVLLDLKQAEAFREAGRHLHDLACDRGLSAIPESFTRATLRAIGLDLRHLEGLLAHTARGRFASELPPDDDALAAQAALYALKVHELAGALEADLGRPPSPPPPADPLAR